MRTPSVFVLVLGLSLGATQAEAQRRPIGSEETEKVQLPDGDDPGVADTEAARAAEDKKRAEEERSKAEAERRKAEKEKRDILEQERKREEAEKAARMAAEKARHKKEEAEKRKKVEAEAKKRASAEKRHRAALKAARAERVLVRTSGSVRLRFMLSPGAPEIKAVEEVRIDIAEKLEVPDPTFGEFKPISGAQLVATVSLAESLEAEPAPSRSKRGKVAPEPPKPLRYRVHALEDAGLYGFHTTMLVPGKYRVEIAGKGPKGRVLEGGFDLFPGVWPPPDWEAESKQAAESSGRRRPILMD